MVVPSSDVIEILSTTRPARVRPDPARPSSPLVAAPLSVRHGSKRVSSASIRTSNVITLSDEDSQDERPRLERGTTTRVDMDDDDDDVVVVAESLRPAHDTSSDDLQPLSAVWTDEIGTSRVNVIGRSASIAVASSSRNPTFSRMPQRSHTLGDIPDLEIFDPSSSSSPLQPVEAAISSKSKGKQKQRPEDDIYDGFLPTRPQRARSDDLWANILGSDSDGAGAGKKKKGKGKGKAKGTEADGTRKRLVSSDAESEGAGTTKKRRSPGKKAPRLSAEDRLSKREEAAAERASKTALKKQETADRAKLREANALRTKDKTATAAELTIHISGTAFKVLEYDGSDTEEEDPGGGGSRNGRGKKKKKKEKLSPWLEITQQLSEKMDAHKCAVERPEFPRRDIGCEGAIRWTRVCTTKWDDQRNLFLPLPGGQPIVVEEDSRLVFLTAHDLSLHIARNTLSNFMATLQAHLPPHINLFVLLFGLQTVFRDLERVRQAEYRRDLQRRAGEPEGAAIKPAGIGQGQPTKDELELALMRMQVKSKCMIISVDKVEEAVEWLEQLSFDVGQKPYQRHKQSHITQLGTGEANIVSGKTLQDTYIKMLASLKGVTDAVAAGIAGEYPTMRSLLEAWDNCPGGERGKQDMLIGIGKGRNVDGTRTHRAIGATLSANVYRMLTSRDPDLVI